MIIERRNSLQVVFFFDKMLWNFQNLKATLEGCVSVFTDQMKDSLETYPEAYLETYLDRNAWLTF